MKNGFLIAAFVLAAGCGSQTKSGACKDYEPLDLCDTESTYECVETDDGCRQCGCVPIEDGQGLKDDRY